MPRRGKLCIIYWINGVVLCKLIQGRNNRKYQFSLPEVPWKWRIVGIHKFVNGCNFKASSMFCVVDLCRLQAAAHIHKYLNLDEDKLKEITRDSQEGGFFLLNECKLILVKFCGITNVCHKIMSKIDLSHWGYYLFDYSNFFLDSNIINY